MQVKRKRKTQRQVLMDALEGCEGWRKGKTWQQLATEVYGKADPGFRANLRSRISQLKKIYMMKDHKSLMSIRGNDGEYRYCFVQTAQEASSGLNMLFIQANGSVSGMKRQQVILWPKIPQQIKKQLEALQLSLGALVALPPREFERQMEEEEEEKEKGGKK